MTYHQAEEILNSLPAFHHVGTKAYKPGLERMLSLMEAMGQAHRRLSCIHVAGTNGKGSTSSMMAASLTAAGYKTGLYTSPHLVDWRERIRINGQIIDTEYISGWAERYANVLREVKPSYFEAITALAFCYFADQQVDYAVIECGLGGRLDSTNIITPKLCVITNIGLDHTAILGDSRAQIAAEKAGIIKDGIPCVIGERDEETEGVFNHRAATCHTHIIWADSTPWYEGKCDLKGDYQKANARTAACALNQLGIPVDLSRTAQLSGLRGRWEVIHEQPLTICDTGHNSHGIRTYIAQLKQLMEEHRDAYLRIVIGMVNDKDVEQVLSLLPMDAVYYWTAARTERAIDADQLRQMGLLHGLIGRAFPTTEQAQRAIEIEANKEDVVLVAGSNFIVGEWLEMNPKDK